jgi:hypothetical protein
MPVIADFSFVKFDDGTITVGLQDPTPIGGWDIQFVVSKRFDGASSGIVTKSVASGFNGASGITITDSGQGHFNIALNGIDTSGLEPGNYATRTERTTSGFHTTLTLGYLILLPR